MKFYSFLFFFFGTLSVSFTQSNTPAVKNQQELKSAPPVQNNSLEIKSIESQPVEKENTSSDKEESQELEKKKSTTRSVADAQVATQLQQQFSQVHQKAITQNFSRSPGAVEQQEMNRVVLYYEKYAPTSFEYHFFKYVSGNYNVGEVKHLNEAERLKPKNSDVLVQKAAYSLIVADSANVRHYLSKLVDVSKLDADALNYAKQVVNSLPENGVLFTHGFDDGFGSFYWREVKQERPDIRVLSLDFMQSKAYRDSLSEIGFLFPARESIDVDFFKEFCELNSEFNLFISMTFPKPYLAAVQPKLIVCGLTFAYSNPTVSNDDTWSFTPAVAVNHNEVLWETYGKSYLQKHEFGEKGKQLAANYLPMLFLLRAHYIQLNDSKKLDQIERMIDFVAVSSNRYRQVKALRN